MRWFATNWIYIPGVFRAVAAVILAWVGLARHRRERRQEQESNAEREIRRRFMVAGPDPECNAMWARILDAKR